MNYRSEIDGLRAVAVIPVVLFHAGSSTFGGGYVGVDVFFVISGYLITSILISDLENDRFSILRFYERRARRILPALFVVMLACLPFAWALMLPSELKDFSDSLIATSIFSSNFLFWQESGYFAHNSELKPLLHTWSLAIEEQYYVVFPIALFIVWRFGRKFVFFTILCFALLSLSLSQLAVQKYPEASFYLLPTRAWELLAGSLCAMLTFNKQPFRSDFFAVAGLSLIFFAVLAFDERTPFPSVYTLVPVAGTCLVVLFATSGSLVARLLSIRLIVGIGLISYSAYLWHQPLFAFSRLGSSDAPNLATMMFLVSISFGLAVLTWRYVEQPFRQQSKPLLTKRSTIFAAAALASVAFISIGVAGQLSGGFIHRYAPQDRQLAALNVREEGAYAVRNFRAHKLMKFPDNGLNNVMIVGDSYGYDFINALFEQGLEEVANYSTHHIFSRCGNLLLEGGVAKRTGQQLRNCEHVKGYSEPRLAGLLAKADYLFLVSRWELWHTQWLRQSVENLQQITDAKIVIVGRKHFGIINPRALLRIPAEERLVWENTIPSTIPEVNRKIVEQDPPYYLDLQKILCGSTEKCRVFTPDGRLISNDGGHLSRDGARYVGERLLQESPIIREAVSAK